MQTITQINANGQEIKYKTYNGTAYHAETDIKIVNILEAARINDNKIRVFYGDTKTGKAWPEENDTIGRVGRSTGSIKIPLLIGKPSDNDGGGILDHCIVAIKQGGSFIYFHPQFTIGVWDVIELDPDNIIARANGLFYEVSHNGNTHAAFNTRAKAEAYAAFMSGASDKF